ncbi:hypothetical protein H6F96_25035 [Microcoleus sp. FACHB-53]|nr:hypothetical protein [Microcoleus sp. FACHB-53]
MICIKDVGFNAIAHLPLPKTRSHPLILPKYDRTSPFPQKASHPLILLPQPNRIPSSCQTQ